jgi:hypothetical protein
VLAFLGERNLVGILGGAQARVNLKWPYRNIEKLALNKPPRPKSPISSFEMFI